MPGIVLKNPMAAVDVLCHLLMFPKRLEELISPSFPWKIRNDFSGILELGPKDLLCEPTGIFLVFENGVLSAVESSSLESIDQEVKSLLASQGWEIFDRKCHTKSQYQEVESVVSE